tara:strand:+ start:885 stop:1367 length:483 start_codon:yes stop_codon:yes gene_type:complete
MIKKNLSNYFIIILFVFFIDRVSKQLVIYLNGNNLNSEIFLSKFLNIQLIWNDGVAFGLFASDNIFYYHSLTGFIILIILILIYFSIKTNGLEKYGFLIILGGSLGNVYDRITYSAVPDFIDIHYQSFHWFIFNVADIFITIGVFLLIYIELVLKNKKSE